MRARRQRRRSDRFGSAGDIQTAVLPRKEGLDGGIPITEGVRQSAGGRKPSTMSCRESPKIAAVSETAPHNFATPPPARPGFPRVGGPDRGEPYFRREFGRAARYKFSHPLPPAGISPSRQSAKNRDLEPV